MTPKMTARDLETAKHHVQTERRWHDRLFYVEVILKNGDVHMASSANGYDMARGQVLYQVACRSDLGELGPLVVSLPAAYHTVGVGSREDKGRDKKSVA